MLSRFLDAWKLIRERNKKTIRRKIRRLVFNCSGFSILILSAVMFYGMFGIRYDAIDTGAKIGELAVQSSGNSLEKAQQQYLLMLTQERSLAIAEELEDLKESVEAMQRAVTRMFTHPENYPERYIAEANPNDGDGLNYMAWIFYAPNFSDNSYVRAEIGKLANLQTTMISISERIGRGRSITPFIASRNGFIIEADNKLPEWAFPNKNMTQAQTFNFYDRSWFKRAQTEGKLFFTDPYPGGRDGMLAISCAAPYYYPDGEFAGVVGIGASLDRISDIVLSTKISSEGFSFVVDDEGHLILSQKKDGLLGITAIAEEKDLRTSQDADIAFMAKEMLRNEEGNCRIILDGITYNVTFSTIRTVNWSFAVAVNDDIIQQVLEHNRELIRAETEEQVEDISARIFQTMSLMVLAIIVIATVIGFFGQRLSKKLTEPILELADKVSHIEGGNLDEKIDLKTGDEIEYLATCFNSMTSKLKDHMNNLKKVTAEKEKISTELSVATSIQQSMLPHDFNFGRADFDIFATMNAAKAVGGDFYDFYLLDENHLIITMADVSGKGVPAALFMANSKTILKNFATMMQTPDDLAAVMTLANKQLCQNNDEMMFVTVFIGMLDLKSGRFIFVNGGHNPPLIYKKAENKFEYLQVEQNCVLGMMDDIDFVQQEINLNHGDIIYLYTDGVTEAMDEQNNQYGEARLAEVLNGADKTADLKIILQKVSEDLAKHAGTAEQSDDITMLAVRLLK